jgi:hypothetical protein
MPPCKNIRDILGPLFNSNPIQNPNVTPKVQRQAFAVLEEGAEKKEDK